MVAAETKATEAGATGEAPKAKASSPIHNR